LGILVALVAEMSVDPLDHRYRGSRHSGDQEHVHASHKHLADPQVTERIDRDAVPNISPLSDGTESLGDTMTTPLTPIPWLSEKWLTTSTPVTPALDDGECFIIQRNRPRWEP
jgi:hypothetical protein